MVNLLHDLGDLRSGRVFDGNQPRLEIGFDVFGADALIEHAKKLLDGIQVGRLGSHDEGIEPHVGDDVDGGRGESTSARGAATAEQEIAHQAAAYVAEGRAGDDCS